MIDVDHEQVEQNLRLHVDRLAGLIGPRALGKPKSIEATIGYIEGRWAEMGYSNALRDGPPIIKLGRLSDASCSSKCPRTGSTELSANRVEAGAILPRDARKTHIEQLDVPIQDSLLSSVDVDALFVRCGFGAVSCSHTWRAIIDTDRHGA